jgi:hypothetical protein
MSESIATKKMTVLVQENGIVRNSSGRIIAKLDDETPFESEHVVPDVSDEAKAVEAFKVKFNLDKEHRLATAKVEYAGLCAQVELNYEQQKTTNALHHAYECKMIEASEFFMPPLFTIGTQGVNRFTNPGLMAGDSPHFMPAHGSTFGGNPMWNQRGYSLSNQNQFDLNQHTNVFKANTDLGSDHQHQPEKNPR